MQSAADTSVCFTILGSSSGNPQPERACSGYVLDVDHRLTMFDCGGGVAQSFLRLGFDHLCLDRVFISHTHPDHVCDLPLLLQALYLTRRDNRFDIFVPEEFVSPLRQFLSALYLIPDRFTFPWIIRGYGPGEVLKVPARITAIANTHLEKLRSAVESLGLPNQMQSHSFIISAGGRTIVYSADLGSFADIREHLDGADLALIETSHVPIDEIVRCAGTSPKCRFVLTHLGNAEAIATLQQQIAESGVDNAELAVDGRTYQL